MGCIIIDYQVRFRKTKLLLYGDSRGRVMARVDIGNSSFTTADSVDLSKYDRSVIKEEK